MSRQPDFVARVIEIIESSPDLQAAEYAIRAEYGGDKPYVAKTSPERDTQIIYDMRNGYDLATVCRQHRVSRYTVERLWRRERKVVSKLG